VIGAAISGSQLEDADEAFRIVVNSVNVRRFLSRNVGIRRETEESTRKTPGETAPRLASFITIL
jgi:hypothetical protein